MGLQFINYPTIKMYRFFPDFTDLRMAVSHMGRPVHQIEELLVLIVVQVLKKIEVIQIQCKGFYDYDLPVCWHERLAWGCRECRGPQTLDS